MMGYKYWGGFYDIEEYLNNRGFEVFVVSIGPVSSNWDRAVEIYYQLKGGQLDYGKSHADKYGIIQKPEGKMYEGMYPEWDENHPVHLIGHSMGGQTVRMLDYLLENSFYADSSENTFEESDLLGQKLSGWIKSITSISSPHNGTTYYDVRTKTLPFVQNFIGLAASMGTDLYDFDLEHWGLKQREGENWQDYYIRIHDHSVWESKNISTWDLSVRGAQEMNTKVTANPNVYYFSYATTCSVADEITGYHIPHGKVYITLRNNVKNIGQEIAIFSDGTKTDSTWFENDGVVNVNSMWGPTTGLNGPDLIVPYNVDDELVPGRWYTFPKYEMDHYYIIGQAAFTKKQMRELFKIYSNHCRILHSLPK
jgi:triacylglycerol lipase